MIKFGPSGNSEKFIESGYKTSEQSALWVKNMGLDCFEYSFGRGVNLSDERAVVIGKAFFTQGVEISVHAPYYINFANPDDEMAKKSVNYVIDSAKKVKLLGGNRVVFHPASQGKAQRKEAVNLTEKRINELVERIYAEGLNDIKFCPETMGKKAQIGTVEEIARFCKTDKCLIPCVDFGHVNAREGGILKTEDDFIKIISYLTYELGDKAKEMHVHFSKIEYTEKGEVKHLTFDDEIYGPDYIPFISAVKKTEISPYVISESAGTQDIDALKMKKAFIEN